MCGQCRRDLPAANYHRSKSYKDGLTGKCKECAASVLSQWKEGRMLAEPRYRDRQGGYQAAAGMAPNGAHAHTRITVTP